MAKGILETIMGVFGGKKKGVMGDIEKLGELKDQAGEMLEKHEDQISAITDKIPGQVDDQLVDKAKEVLK